MDKAQIFNFLTQQRSGYIAPFDNPDYPVMRAMVAALGDENKIYFTTRAPAEKLNLILSNDKAYVYFHKSERFTLEGLYMMGEIKICTDQAIIDMIRQSLDNRYKKYHVTYSGYCILQFTGITAQYYGHFKTETIEL